MNDADAAGSLTSCTLWSSMSGPIRNKCEVGEIDLDTSGITRRDSGVPKPHEKGCMLSVSLSFCTATAK